MLMGFSFAKGELKRTFSMVYLIIVLHQIAQMENTCQNELIID